MGIFFLDCIVLNYLKLLVWHMFKCADNPIISICLTRSAWSNIFQDVLSSSRMSGVGFGVYGEYEL